MAPEGPRAVDANALCAGDRACFLAPAARFGRYRRRQGMAGREALRDGFHFPARDLLGESALIDLRVLVDGAVPDAADAPHANVHR